MRRRLLEFLVGLALIFEVYWPVPDYKKDWGIVAYKIALPTQLVNLHNVFHMSSLGSIYLTLLIS